MVSTSWVRRSDEESCFLKMFHICKVSYSHINIRSIYLPSPKNACLCVTGERPAKVVYCYGDLVPRTIKDQGDIIDDGGDDGGSINTDLLAAHVAVTSLGIIAM
jgi:hypothetical protein